MQQKDAGDLTKQNVVFFKTQPFKKDSFKKDSLWIHIGKTGRSTQKRIKEQDQDIWFTHTQTSTVSEHAHDTGHYLLGNEVKFIDLDPHW